MEPQHTEMPPRVLIRDFAIFLAKLALDGIKDVILIKLSIIAVIFDLAIGGSRRGRFFYKVMRLGERMDLWLNLYGAAHRARANPDGLFGESRAGDATFLGEMEELVRRGDGASAPVRPAGPIPVRPGIPAGR